ncbi:hypothetical protein [Kutzneria sp. CA-103260]|uniref:hypothetical protein n=1 Tax=Kutzneria sp. CA-103260 TaxID=2802641 RepID=UPI001BA4CF91|nr:hypothetical protein [Kutzneria sp. CA-103260]QUQ62865.1 hypothetical protein JJ691_05770 [Kutzneria sp. CA-103260]
MTTYSEMTQQFGDQYVAAVKRTGDAVADGVTRLTSLVDPSKVPFVDDIAKTVTAFGAALPQPAEIVEANFALAERVLVAQRDFTARLLGKAEEKTEEKVAG